VLHDFVLPTPVPGLRDLLVNVRAVAVNPLDTKIRRGGGPGGPAAGAKVLGWDAAGVVSAVGPAVTGFAPGDEVYYAGSVDRSGCYCEFHLVDERLVGRKPATIGFAEAAALPLTAVTAWEMLFDRLRIGTETEGALLILGGAGGVGSIAIQLARQLTRLRVIATASRPESMEWCKRLDAHDVIDHSRPLGLQTRAVAPLGASHALALTKLEEHFDEVIAAMAPQGGIAWIENPSQPLDVVKLKPKSLALHAEFMFTRPRYETPDMGEQGRILTKVSELLDTKRIRSTAQLNLGPINAENMRKAHALVETGRTIGKVVLAGFR
jgi:zinc-binding alcohol dehydrogenase family protein